MNKWLGSCFWIIHWKYKLLSSVICCILITLQFLGGYCRLKIKKKYKKKLFTTVVNICTEALDWLRQKMKRVVKRMKNADLKLKQQGRWWGKYERADITRASRKISSSAYYLAHDQNIPLTRHLVNYFSMKSCFYKQVKIPVSAYLWRHCHLICFLWNKI